MNQTLKRQVRHKSYGQGIIFALLLFVPVIVRAQATSIDEITRQRARAYEPLLMTTAPQHGIDARLLWVIAYLESRFRPWVVSPKGAQGLMQLMPATAARWGVQNAFEPGQAITGAARYVQYLQYRFDGRVDLTLAAYNAGEAAVGAYLTGRAVRVGGKVINPYGMRTDGVPPYRETRAYVRAGVALLQRFSVGNAPAHVVKTSQAQAVPSLHGEVLTTTPTIRKSISYAADAISSAAATPTAVPPRSISYQSR